MTPKRKFRHFRRSLTDREDHHDHDQERHRQQRYVGLVDEPERRAPLTPWSNAGPALDRVRPDDGH